MLDAIFYLFMVRNFLCCLNFVNVLNYINVQGFVKVLKCGFAFALFFFLKRNAWT